MPLTPAELTHAREELYAAKLKIEPVKDIFRSVGYIPDARMLNEVLLALVDEIDALNKEISGLSHA